MNVYKWWRQYLDSGQSYGRTKPWRCDKGRMIGSRELGSTAHDWVTEDFSGEKLFVIRFNKQEKDKLRRSWGGAIQEESREAMEDFRWDYASRLGNQLKSPAVGENDEQGRDR